MTNVNKGNIISTIESSNSGSNSDVISNDFESMNNFDSGNIQPYKMYYANKSELLVIEKEIDDLIDKELKAPGIQDDDLDIDPSRDDLQKMEMANCDEQGLALTTEKVFNPVELKHLLEKVNFDDNEVDNIRFQNKYINLFLPRRDIMNYFYGRLCGIVMLNPEGNTKRIKQFPKCSAYLTKRACQCDNKCVELNSDIEYEKRCVLYDLSDINTDTRYLDSCEELAFRPVDNVLVKYTFGKNIKESGIELIENIKKVCDGEIKNMDKAICSAYELRDECRNNESCMKEAVFKIRCANKENIKDVEKILGFPLTEYNVRNKRFLAEEIQDAITNNIKTSIKESIPVSFNDLSLICVITFIILGLIKCVTRRDGAKGTFLISFMAVCAIGLLTLHKNYLS